MSPESYAELQQAHRNLVQYYRETLKGFNIHIKTHNKIIDKDRELHELRKQTIDLRVQLQVKKLEKDHLARGSQRMNNEIQELKATLKDIELELDVYKQMATTSPQKLQISHIFPAPKTPSKEEMELFGEEEQDTEGVTSTELSRSQSTESFQESCQNLEDIFSKATTCLKSLKDLDVTTEEQIEKLFHDIEQIGPSSLTPTSDSSPGLSNPQPTSVM